MKKIFCFLLWMSFMVFACSSPSSVETAYTITELYNQTLNFPIVEGVDMTDVSIEYQTQSGNEFRAHLIYKPSPELIDKLLGHNKFLTSSAEKFFNKPIEGTPCWDDRLMILFEDVYADDIQNFNDKRCLMGFFEPSYHLFVYDYTEDLMHHYIIPLDG